jgi:hypothetical protein
MRKTEPVMVTLLFLYFNSPHVKEFIVRARKRHVICLDRKPAVDVMWSSRHSSGEGLGWRSLMSGVTPSSRAFTCSFLPNASREELLLATILL